MENLTEKKPRAVGNLLVMVMFTCLGLVELIGSDFVGASVWLSLAAALASFGPEETRWAAIPLRRRVVGLALLGASVALFGYQIGKDIAS